MIHVEVPPGFPPMTLPVKEGRRLAEDEIILSPLEEKDLYAVVSVLISDNHTIT